MSENQPVPVPGAEPAAEPAAEAPAASPPRAARSSRAPLLAFIAIVLAAALAALFWFDVRERLAATQEEVARRLRDVEESAREARAGARQAQEALREAQAKIGQLETRMAESQSQQLALESLYQDLSRNRDEWQLAEIEQVLAIASQQLQLARNVRAALLALQLAESRLARADRPQFQPIREALARDIERLKALPAADLASLSARIEGLIAAVDSLPLEFEERGERAAAQVPGDAAGPAPEGNALERLAAEVWSELRSLVVVRRMAEPEAPLLAPAQSYFLRENLRLRLLNARLSLLARDEAGYRADLQAASRWIERYFDADSKQAAESLSQIKRLLGASFNFEMPAISESLEAVRAHQSRRSRTPE